MASVFSYYATCLHYSSDRNDQLTRSPRTSHGFLSPLHISSSSVTVELIRLLIATIVTPHIRNVTYLTTSWNRGE